jgi:hypothetical protein
MTTLLTRRNLLLGSASVILFKTRALADHARRGARYYQGSDNLRRPDARCRRVGAVHSIIRDWVEPATKRDHVGHAPKADKSPASQRNDAMGHNQTSVRF